MSDAATSAAPRTAAVGPADRPADTAVVSARGLTKHFPRRRSWRETLAAPLRRADPQTAVDDVSFSVRPGEFFGLLGANGAGKSTLFRMLATHLLPDAGSASIAGSDLVREPLAVRRTLTAVNADERSLHWRLTARANLELFAALYGLHRTTASARIDQLLHTVELRDTGSKLVGSFSSGMKQRLLIARALLANPRVLLLDEPTRSLDPVAARAFRHFLRAEIAHRQQCAILLATHAADEAFDLCDRVAILHHGRLLAVGPARELATQVGDDLHTLSIRHGHRAAFDHLAARLGLGSPRYDDHPDGGDWVDAHIRIPGAPEAAAHFVAAATRDGIPIARIEPVRPTLADLLDHITRHGPIPH